MFHFDANFPFAVMTLEQTAPERLIDRKLFDGMFTTLLIASGGRDGGTIMPRGKGIAHTIAVLLLATPSIVTAQGSSPPPAMWRDVGQVGVLCLVETPRGVDNGPLHERICSAAERAAAKGATIAPLRFATGDPRILRPDTVTMLVHAAVSTAAGGDILAISVRPYRNIGNDPGLLFAAAPVALPVDAARRDDAALATAMARAFARTLPWTPPAGARRIER